MHRLSNADAPHRRYGMWHWPRQRPYRFVGYFGCEQWEFYLVLSLRAGLPRSLGRLVAVPTWRTVCFAAGVTSIMTRLLCFFGTPLKRLLHARIPLPTVGQLTAGLSLLGILGLA